MCYKSVGWPISGSLTLEQCKDWCLINTDCVRVDWYSRGACYAYVPRANSDYCINNARPNGPKYVTCNDQGMRLF